MSNILFYIDIIGPAVVLLTFLVAGKKLSGELKLVFWFCLTQVVCNAFATYLASMAISNYFIYKINTVASLIILLILFGKYLLHFTKRQYIITIAVVVLIIFPTFFGEGIKSYNSYSASLSSLIIVLLCVIFFYTKLVRSSPQESMPAKAIFWCVVGFFVYYAGTFFIFMSYKFLIETDIKSIGILWKFHNLLLLIACLSISYGVLCKDYRPIS
ncbi:MAG: hypothetical protein ACK5NK_03830 [Niabella sp.]